MYLLDFERHGRSLCALLLIWLVFVADITRALSGQFWGIVLSRCPRTENMGMQNQSKKPYDKRLINLERSGNTAARSWFEIFPHEQCPHSQLMSG